MVHIQWKDRYNIGYKEIDTQHKSLLGVLNELIDLVDEGRDPEHVARIFHQLCDYVRIHFSTEERYMRACGYPRLTDHEGLHATFVQKLLELNAAYDPADPHLLIETLDFVKHWYLDHIIKADMDYVPFLKRYQTEATIKAVIFDFGNVLSSFDNDRFLKGLSTLCGVPDAVLKTRLYLQSTLTQDYEAGRIDSREFLEGVSALCGTDLPEADFIRAYTDIFTPIEATHELIRNLKPAYRIGLLSNTNPWHFEHAIQTSDVFPLFDSVTLSFEVGASKPDPRLFEDALSKLGLMAEECVYIDDQHPFALAAAEHLMHGLTYTTPVALMSQLRQLKVAF
jgi:HAD superfamily hydrolase (TIGR01509 family)